MILEATKENIQKAAEVLKNGGVVGMPTETVYGLAANALNKDAVDKIYKLKNRPISNPLIVHVHSIGQIFLYASDELENQIREKVLKLKNLLGGPLSVILPSSNKIATNVTASGDTVAFRIPSHPVALELLRECELPLAAPSANISNYVSPTSADHVEDSFGSGLEMILDGGNCKVGIESTVLKLSADENLILRPGAITAEDIGKALGQPVKLKKLLVKETDPIISPGLLEKHYSPITPLYFIENYTDKFANKNIAAVKFSETKPPINSKFKEVVYLSKNENHAEIAEKIFSTLRNLDKGNYEAIFIDKCQEIGLGIAIMDRLKRAVRKA